MATSKFRSQFLESRLEVREVQLQLASDAADLGTWTWEPSTGEISCSPRFLSLINARADEPLVMDSLLDRVHPDDVATVKRAMNAALQLKTVFSAAFRVMSPVGSVRNLSLYGRAHPSVLHKNQPALSGVLRESVSEPDAISEKLSSRFRLLAHQIETLRKVEQRTLTSRLNSEVSRSLTRLRHELSTLSRSNLVTPKLSASLNELAGEAEAGLESVRRTIFEMQPPGVEDLGFIGALERYATEHATRAGLKLSLSIPMDPIPAEPGALSALYAVAQAGIDNVVRHAHARNMNVTVTLGQDELRLKIADDGAGISARDLLKPESFSLLAATEQLAKVGGRLKTAGVPSRGTILEARVPMKLRRGSGATTG